MRLWPVRRGKIDRKQFRETFGLNSDFIVRYPKLRALLEEFDARVVNEYYRPRRVDSGLVTVLRRSPERLELATGDRRDDQTYRRVQA